MWLCFSPAIFPPHESRNGRLKGSGNHMPLSDLRPSRSWHSLISALPRNLMHSQGSSWRARSTAARTSFWSLAILTRNAGPQRGCTRGVMVANHEQNCDSFAEEFRGFPPQLPGPGCGRGRSPSPSPGPALPKDLVLSKMPFRTGLTLTPQLRHVLGEKICSPSSSSSPEFIPLCTAPFISQVFHSRSSRPQPKAHLSHVRGPLLFFRRHHAAF
jgi:hypothetical protein